MSIAKPGEVLKGKRALVKILFVDIVPALISNERDVQRGPFGQVMWGPVTIGGYWFNPGSNGQVFVGMIGATF